MLQACLEQLINQRSERNFMSATVLSFKEEYIQLSESKLEAKPFVKWVGGKRSILSTLLDKKPDNFERYYEPFLGGGALFFSLQPSNAVLSDINFSLVRTYQALKVSVDDVIDHLHRHKQNHCKEYYLKTRDSFANHVSDVELAAKFIYLNKTCYNGLFRVNKSGKFNVPMGSYKNPRILDDENLRAVSKTLANTVIQQGTVEQIGIESNAFYYLDPPYHKTFSSYDKAGFGDKEHHMLAMLCKKIDEAGSKFMLSNSDTPYIRKLYQRFNRETVMAGRMISCKSNQRGKEAELLIRNYG